MTTSAAPSAEGADGLAATSHRARLVWRRAADEALIASIFGEERPADRAQPRHAPSATVERRSVVPAF